MFISHHTRTKREQCRKTQVAAETSRERQLRKKKKSSRSTGAAAALAVPAPVVENATRPHASSVVIFISRQEPSPAQRAGREEGEGVFSAAEAVPRARTHLPARPGRDTRARRAGTQLHHRA